MAVTFDEAERGKESIRGADGSQMGTLNVLDLLVTPFPLFLREFGIERPLVGKRNTCPSSDILKSGSCFIAGKTGSRNAYLAIQLTRSRGSARI